MYEFTHKGLGLSWKSLDRREKILAGASIGSAVVSIAPFLKWIGKASYEAGYALGYASAKGVPPAYKALPPLEPWAAWWMIGFALLAGLLWWQFSRLQDELFNRIQNWALAMAGGFTTIGVTIWGLLAQSGQLPPMVAIFPFIVFEMLVIGFWVVAVRRWG